MAPKTNRKKITEGLTKSASNAKGAIAEAAGAVKGKAVVAVGAAGTAISSGAAVASEKAARAIRGQKERLYNPFRRGLFLDGFRHAEARRDRGRGYSKGSRGLRRGDRLA